ALDVPKLLAAWQTFWREDGHLAAEGFSYRESGPHLMLMAFLQRILNGGRLAQRTRANRRKVALPSGCTIRRAASSASLVA
ncbi:MAG TPA: hypothetical protein VNO30_50860, partial [Kofleriaceae bacterium]|nr:hypothetical protein [Kofleriaceae bacterium]